MNPAEKTILAVALLTFLGKRKSGNRSIPDQSETVEKLYDQTIFLTFSVKDPALFDAVKLKELQMTAPDIVEKMKRFYGEGKSYWKEVGGTAIINGTPVEPDAEGYIPLNKDDIKFLLKFRNKMGIPLNEKIEISVKSYGLFPDFPIEFTIALNFKSKYPILMEQNLNRMASSVFGASMSPDLMPIQLLIKWESFWPDTDRWRWNLYPILGNDPKGGGNWKINLRYYPEKVHLAETPPDQNNKLLYSFIPQDSIFMLDDRELSNMIRGEGPFTGDGLFSKNKTRRR